jgi:hypothetical protein
MAANRRMIGGLVGLALVLGLVGAGPAAAQVGSDPVTLEGTLTAVEPASDVLVRTTAGVPVTITLAAPTMDAVLTVFDAVGQEVAYNDDHEGFPLPSGRDAAIQFTPELSDLLLVRAASLGWAYTGAYVLTLEGVDVIEQNPVSIAQNASGNVVEGRLPEDADRVPHVAYTFPALAGWTVTLRSSSLEFDPMLSVYDSTGEQVASNDDHDPDVFDLPNRTDAALTFTAPSDGMYAVLVRPFEDDGSGRFTLVIDGATFGAVTPEAAEPEAGVCDNVLGSVVAASSTFGGNYNAENLLDDSLTTGWSSRGDDATPYLIFEVNAGATVRLDGVVFDGFSSSPGFVNDSVRAFEVAVSPTLTDPENFTPVFQAEAPLDNVLQTYSFEPIEARYVLLRLLSNYGGGYFQATEFNACTTLSGSASGNLSGEAPFVVDGRLREDEPYVEYRLFAGEGASLIATLASEDFDPVLEIYDENLRRVADNDDHGEGFDLPRLRDAGLRVTLSEPGMLFVRVRSFAGGGAFTLTLDGTGLQAQPPEVPLLPRCEDVSSQAVGGAVVGFSSEFAGRWLASYLNDGSAETGWASAPGRDSARREWVIVDLAGDEPFIDSIRINPSATGGDSSDHNVSRFAVLVSTTDSEPDSFTEVFATLLSERFRYTLAFDLPEPVTARYVMLETRDTFGGRWHEVAEFTVCAVE